MGYTETWTQAPRVTDMTTPSRRAAIEHEFDHLPLHEQLLLIERLVRRVRQSTGDPAGLDRALEQMAADPDIQRVLRGDDLVPKNAAG